MCPLWKTIGMMKSIVHYYESAKKAIIETSKSANKINWNYILSQTKDLFYRLTQYKFESPKQSRHEFEEMFAKYCEEVTVAFRKITER